METQNTQEYHTSRVRMLEEQLKEIKAARNHPEKQVRINEKSGEIRTAQMEWQNAISSMWARHQAAAAQEAQAMMSLGLL